MPFVALGCTAALFLYLHLFHFPWVPVVRFGDQFYYAEHAERMLRGEVLYCDLFQFNLPGTECLYYALFRLVGPALWVAPLLLLLAGTAATLLAYSLARKVLPREAAWLPPLAVLVICLRSSLDGSHHWYSTTLVLLAIDLIASRCDFVRIGLGGACLGMASLFTSSRGVFVVAGVCAFLLWKLRPGREVAKMIAALLLPFAAVVGSAMAYLAYIVGAKLLFNSVLVFPLRYYSAGAANSVSVYLDEWSSFLPLRWSSLLLASLWLAVNAGVPLVLIGFFAGPFRHHAAELRNSPAGQRLVLFSIAGSAAALGVAGAPSGPRLNCAAIFAFVVGTALLRQVGASRGANHWIRGMLAFAVVLGLAEMSATQARWSRKLNGPRGAVVLQSPESYAEFEWVARHARQGDGLFGDTSFNFIFGMKNPAPVPFVEPDGYTRPEQVQSVVAALEHQHTQFLVWSDELENGRTPDDNLKPLRLYVHERYLMVQKFPDGTEIWSIKG